MSERAEFFVMRHPFEDEPLHYTASGLDYVYLLNGFTVEDDPDYGRLLTINAVDDLHRAIGLRIVRQERTLTGAEFKFLRKAMSMTQEELADTLKVDVQTVANYEKGRTIPGSSDQLMRMTFIIWIMPPDAKAEFLKEITAEVQRRKELRTKKGKAARRRSSNAIVKCWQEGNSSATA